MQQIASPFGTFTCLALDHRQNLRKALNPLDPSSTTDEDLSRFKLDVTSTLAGYASAVLLDPEVSAAQAVAAGAVPGSLGLVVAVESTGYSGTPTARKGQVLPGWSIEKAKRMGASAVKLLVYYHPEGQTAPDIEAFVSQIAEECQKQDLCLMLEPLSYPLHESQPLTSEQKRSVVVETARRLSPLGIDILKAEFPLGKDSTESEWQQACEEITTASTTPWILLSAAVSFETYLRQVTAACLAGASGIAVGRAVWQEAVSMKGEERLSFLRSTGLERLSRLYSLCSALAHPFSETVSASAPFNWYQNYDYGTSL
jgi:tagatose-1,6-bisphosphate aldolase